MMTNFKVNIESILPHIQDNTVCDREISGSNNYLLIVRITYAFKADAYNFMSILKI